MTGVTGLYSKWTKTAIWSFVFVVTFSAIGGLWILIIGEPFSSFKTALHTSTGGTIFGDEFLREKDLKVSALAELLGNSGLSFALFTYSYQLAIAMTIVLGALFFKKKIIKKVFLFFISIILIATMITNTERATVLSVLIGIFALLIKELMRML